MGANVDEIDRQIAELEEKKRRALAVKKKASRYPQHIAEIVDKWTGNDFDSVDGNGDEHRRIRIINGDIAKLLDEIDRLMIENRRLEGELRAAAMPAKSAGAIEGSAF